MIFGIVYLLIPMKLTTFSTSGILVRRLKGIAFIYLRGRLLGGFLLLLLGGLLLGGLVLGGHLFRLAIWTQACFLS